MDWLEKLSKRVWIIAEAGINHNGDMGFIRDMVDAATRAGADAIKFQSFRTEALLAPDAPKARYQLQTTDPGESQFEMLKRAELSMDQHAEIISCCREKGIVFISTPFEEQSADLLEALDVPLFKIPSGEITNLPFLSHVALKGRPMIISTGMSFLGEVEKAVQTVHENGCEEVALLHCTSNYPASAEEVNLKAMCTMQQAFRLPVGFSDHTVGIETAAAAVALGARIVEKYFTLDRNLPGPDHKASLEPEQLVQFVRAIRNVEAARGDGLKQPAPSERSNRDVLRKSLAFKSAVAASTVISREMLVAKRPGTGVSPSRIEEVVGRRLLRSVEKDTPVSWEILGP